MKPYDVPNERKADHAVDDIFINRWSPRAMSGESISEEDLMSLFEAARWSPSSSNGQPWKFLYAMRETPEWNEFFDLLVELNQMWCKNAGALLLVISRKNFEAKDGNAEKANKHNSFDAGSAWTSLAMQARLKDLVAHGMAGFDFEKAREVLKIPDSYNIEAMIAVGKQGEIEDLPERMQKHETPNTRRPVLESIGKGKFPETWI